MASIMVEVDDGTAERLRRRAEREGLRPAQLAKKLLTEASEQDPYEFFAIASSDRLRGDQVDDLLARHRSSTPGRSSPPPTPRTRTAMSAAPSCSRHKAR